MVVKVIERCKVSLEDNPNDIGYRAYKYESKEDTLHSVITELEENFDIDNILPCSCEDDFDGECLDSELYSVEVLFGGRYGK